MFHAVFYITKDAVKMCKTKCLVYFIAIRSSVSKLLEQNSIIDSFLCVSLAIKGQQLVFQKIEICSRNKF